MSSALIAALVLTALGRSSRGYIEQRLDPSQMQAIGGNAFYVHLHLTESWLVQCRSDSNEAPTASGLVLFEDASAYGTPHSLHANVGAQGRGAYSHWGDVLYFSSSDNSDPRSNGRVYSVRVPLVLRNEIVLAAALALVLLAVASIHVSASSVAQLLVRLRAAAVVDALRQGGALDTLTMIGWGLGGIVIAGLLYAVMINAVDAMLIARRVVVRIAMNACCAGAGALVMAYLQRPSLKSWRVIFAVIALAVTAWALALRPDVGFGYGLLPPPAIVLVPFAAGAIAAYVAKVWSHRAVCVESLLNPPHSRRTPWLAIAIVLCLAAPMIWSPVVESWNTSGWMDSHGYDVYAHNILSGKVPAGHSSYMPVYQYGLAAVYYFFGHFFFAAQLTNVALAFLTVLFVCLAAWNLFRNVWAVVLVGIWTGFLRQMQYAVHFTQIEAWYIPIFAFGIFAWSCYWRSPTTFHLLLIVLAAAIGINTRNQGALYFGWLCLTPFFIAGTPWRRRVVHSALAVVLLGASLVPWAVRNYVVEGRFSPSAARNAYYVAILNDPRIGFYGLRYWEGWTEIAAEYERKYPDSAERDRIMMRNGLRTPFEHSDWFQRAVFWRTAGFYGLLPNGVLAAERIVPTNWATEFGGYAFWRTTQFVLLPLSLVALLVRPGRTMLFLAGAVIANIALVAMTGATEDRVCYPVLPLHMLMAVATFLPPSRRELAWDARTAVPALANRRVQIAAGICVVVLLAGVRVAFGRPNLYAPLVERAVFSNANVAIDDALPSLNDYAATAPTPPPPDSSWKGRRVRLRLVASNYQCPPKWGGRIAYMPAFTTDPATETYYYAYLLLNEVDGLKRVPIGITWFGATVSERLREGDEVEAEGEVLDAPPNDVAAYWVRVEKARKVLRRSSDIQSFQ